jgi:hypothetical protein
MAVTKFYSILLLDPKKVRDDQHSLLIGYPKDRPEIFLYNLEEAVLTCKELASQNPKIPVVLMEAVEVFETKKPEIIQKSFKENGDLVPK